MGLSETFSKNYKIIRDYVKHHASTPVNTDVDPAITDQSYNPNCIIKSIKQQQKTLSELEIQTISERYKNGASSYELAKEFNCHRRTITDTLRRNGVEVSHQATAKPELVKRIIELYAEYKTPKEVTWHGDTLYEIGTQKEITAGKDNGDYCLSASDTWSHIGEKRCVVFSYTYLACSNGYCFLNEKQNYKSGFVAFFGKYNMYNWDSFSNTYKDKGPIVVCGQIYSYEGHPEIKITDVASQTRLSPQASLSGSTIVYKYSCS